MIKENTQLTKLGIEPPLTKWDSKQQNKRGFPDLELYNLDYTLAYIILGYLKRYKKITLEDLTYYKYRIHDQEYTKEECLDFIIISLEAYLKKDEAFNYFFKEDSKSDEWGQIENAIYSQTIEALRVFADMFPGLWI